MFMLKCWNRLVINCVGWEWGSLKLPEILLLLSFTLDEGRETKIYVYRHFNFAN